MGRIQSKSLSTTKEYYNFFMEIHSKICKFPGEMYNKLNEETKKNGFKSGMNIIKFSQLIGSSWNAFTYVSKYKTLRTDVIENLCQRLESYVNKGNIDAVMMTIERIRVGNRARIPKKWAMYPDEDDILKLSRGAGKKYGFFNMGCGFIMNDEERKFVIDFSKEYFNL